MWISYSHRELVRVVFENEKKSGNLYVELEGIYLSGNINGKIVEVPFVVPYALDFQNNGVKVVYFENYLFESTNDNPNDPKQFYSFIFYH